MPITTPLTELEHLRIRLADAEDKLNTIFSGKVDALVINKNGESNQTFTRNNSDSLYRALVEKMNEGAVIMTDKGIILYANHAFSAFVKMPLEKVIGSFIFNWFTLDCKKKN